MITCPGAPAASLSPLSEANSSPLVSLPPEAARSPIPEKGDPPRALAGAPPQPEPLSRAHRAPPSQTCGSGHLVRAPPTPLRARTPRASLPLRAAPSLPARQDEARPLERAGRGGAGRGQGRGRQPRRAPVPGAGLGPFPREPSAASFPGVLSCLGTAPSPGTRYVCSRAGYCTREANSRGRIPTLSPPLSPHPNLQ